LKVLAISDVHGNVDALKTVLDAAPRHDCVWVLGDLVDYDPKPHVVVYIVKGLKPDAMYFDKFFSSNKGSIVLSPLCIWPACNKITFSQPL